MRLGGQIPAAREGVFIDLDTGVLKLERFLLQRTPMAELCIGFGRREQLLARVLHAELVHKEGFDPSEARDQYGRWSAGAAAAAAFVGERLLATMATGGVASGPAGVAAIGEALSGPAVFFGAYFFPIWESPVSRGDLPDHPGTSYEYNGDTGDFILWRDGAPIFGGSAGSDGLIRPPQSMRGLCSPHHTY